ncbi:hypothetical protein [Paenibacillus senegalimassiliensis]|uniref:hypothetical protein n=1 Tax=Paenibacillus senegalimassiliensis TaxID=1737426 RepID=UPI0016520A73|nr:hypothetical protein [Paenibacillus senegalimassiliensis]
MDRDRFCGPYLQLIRNGAIYMFNSSLLIFVICAFAMGVVLIMSKDRIDPRFRRGLAITSIVMITLAFGLIIYSFLA